MNGQNEIGPRLPGKSGRGNLPEDKLMAYLGGKLTPAEQDEVELWLADEGMESDALEGLKILKPDEIRLSVNQLNHRLRQAARRKNKRRRPINSDQFTWVAIVIILLLVVLAFIIIRKSI